MSVEEQVEENIEEAPEVEEEAKVLTVPIEEPVEAVEAVEPVVKAKAKARGKRGPDKIKRIKPKPKARVAVPKQPVMEEESSDESVDEATLQEIHSLNLLRSIRAYDNRRIQQKQNLYASWFGR